MPAASSTPATAPMTHRTLCMTRTVARDGLSAVQGQLDRRGGAAAVAVGEADVAAPAPHQLAGDREAEPRAGRPAAPRAAAVEALEHLLELVGVDPRALVEHVDGAGARDERDVSAPVVHGVLDHRVERAV